MLEMQSSFWVLYLPSISSSIKKGGREWALGDNYQFVLNDEERFVFQGSKARGGQRRGCRAQLWGLTEKGHRVRGHLRSGLRNNNKGRGSWAPSDAHPAAPAHRWGRGGWKGFGGTQPELLIQSQNCAQVPRPGWASSTLQLLVAVPLGLPGWDVAPASCQCYNEGTFPHYRELLQTPTASKTQVFATKSCTGGC